EGGLCARKKSFTGFGQADTARRADEERCTDARLKRTYRLADRRRRHPEPSGRAAETAVLGDAQERLHAVERTLPQQQASWLIRKRKAIGWTSAGSLRLTAVSSRSWLAAATKIPLNTGRLTSRKNDWASSASRSSGCPAVTSPRMSSPKPWRA